MELLAGWDRARRNVVGTFFLQAKADLTELDVPQPPEIILKSQTYSLPITELEREYCRLDALDETLEAARNEYYDKQKELSLRWEQCSERNDALQKFIASFDDYLNASRLKQEADRKLNSRLDQELLDKTHEVNRLRKELERMKALKIELENRLEISKVYKDYLQSAVKESNGEFENIEHVMARYRELKDIRDRFVKKTVNQVETAFRLENELRDIVQQSKMEEVSGKSYLSEMEKYKNRLQVSNWRRHDNLLAIKEGLKRELLMAHYPKQAIYNLYLLLCQEMEQPVKLSESDFKEQLHFIQRFLKELVKLSNRTKEYFDCPSDVPLFSEKMEGDRSRKGI